MTGGIYYKRRCGDNAPDTYTKPVAYPTQLYIAYNGTVSVADMNHRFQAKTLGAIGESANYQNHLSPEALTAKDCGGLPTA
jgi:hypothetical protein